MITGLAPCSSKRHSTGRRRESTSPRTDLEVVGTESRRAPANISDTATSSPAHTAFNRAASDTASEVLTVFLLCRCDDDDDDDATADGGEDE